MRRRMTACYPIAAHHYCLTDMGRTIVENKALGRHPFNLDGADIMTRYSIALIPLIFAGACATPTPPTVTSADVQASFDEARYLATRPITAFEDLPTGSTRYLGEIGADVTGDINGSIQGDMTMDVSFAGNRIDGSVTDINLIDRDGTPNQQFGGDLTIVGSEFAGRLIATADGDLTAVDSGGFIVDSNVQLDLDGDVVDDLGGGDAVFGSVTGDGVGDINFDVDGVFYGTID